VCLYTMCDTVLECVKVCACVLCVCVCAEESVVLFFYIFSGFYLTRKGIKRHQNLFFKRILAKIISPKS